MASGQLDVMLPSFRALFGLGASASLGDGQLLGRFLAGGDEAREAAFSALVTRHGPMVLGVCRAGLGDPHDADDAFQATFLVLARKARTIRNPDLLGPWLYTVAQQTARKARARRARRLVRESAEANMAELPGSEEVGTLERGDAEALHEEIGRLPGNLRLPIVLCYIEGLTHEEAARRVQCPVGTIRSRMAKARELLRGRLTRRGFAMPALLLASGAFTREVRAAVPVILAERTTRLVASALGQGVATGSASTLADAVIGGWFRVQAGSMAVALFLGGICFLMQRDDPAPTAPAPPAPKAAGVASAPGESQAPAQEKSMTVAGRVIDPDGKPVAGARVGLYLFPRGPSRAGVDKDARLIPADGVTDREGRFRFSAPRVTSVTHRYASVVANAEGFGLGSQTLEVDSGERAVDIRLPRQRMLSGRFIDLQGQPAAGVEAVVTAVQGKEGAGVDSIAFHGEVPEGSLWPRRIRSDDQGRFQLTAAGPGGSVEIQIRDDRFARQDLVLADEASQAGNLASRRPSRSGDRGTFVLIPAHIIEGRVTYADSGKPAGHARLVVQGGRYMSGEADAEGRFRLNPFADNAYRTDTGEKLFTVFAHAHEGEPYLSLSKDIAWPAGASQLTLDFALPRGVLLQGSVKDAESGKPLQGVQVQYEPLPNVPFEPREYVVTGVWTPAFSNRDGSFALAVFPGKGHLLAFGPSPEYILSEYGSQVIQHGSPGGLRKYAQALIPIEVDRNLEPLAVPIQLRKGTTLECRVLDPEGQPLARGTLATNFNVAGQAFRWGGELTPIRDGKAILHGLDPARAYPLVVLDAEHRWGAAIERPANRANAGPLTIRLAPCGSATLRLVDEAGKPISGYTPGLQILLTKGRYQVEFDGNRYDETLAADASTPYLDRRDVVEAFRSGPKGQVSLKNLIPGATYRLITAEKGSPDIDSVVLKDFTFASGETLSLGDITLKGVKVEDANER